MEALWLNGQHYWYTGRIGNERDLSNLVCGQKILMTVSIPVIKQDIYMVRADSWEKRAQTH